MIKTSFTLADTTINYFPL